MKKNRVLILDKEHISYKLRRMAYEIWERNSDEQELTLIGIEHGGAILANKLCELLKEISPLKVRNLTVNVNKKNPINHVLDFDDNLNDASIVLIDDVANSGKTLMYALNALLCYDLKKVQVAVLVDRTHKSFPIASDIVGHTIATTLQNHIEVETTGSEITAVYLE